MSCTRLHCAAKERVHEMKKERLSAALHLAWDSIGGIESGIKLRMIL